MPGTDTCTDTCIDVRHAGHVVHVTLNRPGLRNAFDAATIGGLTRAFTDIAGQPEVRAVVLGATGKAFCAGADLNWMREMAGYTWAENHADATRLADMFWAIAHCPVPVVACVQGDCYGGGVGLVACCDVAVAVHGAGFCLSEARLGLIPATIGPYVIAAMGARAARRYFVTAERFDAVRAQGLGLVHEVCDAAALEEVTAGVVEAIVQNGPMAVRASKQLVRDLAERPIDDNTRDLTARRIADIRASAEGREGLRAFLDKRAPVWRTCGTPPEDVNPCSRKS